MKQEFEVPEGTKLSVSQEEKTPTTWQKIGRIATLAFFAAMFWAGMWIFG